MPNRNPCSASRCPDECIGGDHTTATRHVAVDPLHLIQCLNERARVHAGGSAARSRALRDKKLFSLLLNCCDYDYDYHRKCKWGCRIRKRAQQAGVGQGGGCVANASHSRRDYVALIACLATPTAPVAMRRLNVVRARCLSDVFPVPSNLEISSLEALFAPSVSRPAGWLPRRSGSRCVGPAVELLQGGGRPCFFPAKRNPRASAPAERAGRGPRHVKATVLITHVYLLVVIYKYSSPTLTKYTFMAYLRSAGTLLSKICMTRSYMRGQWFLKSSSSNS